MLGRRGFLGSILGTLLISHRPWAAVPAPHFRGQSPDESEFERMLRLLLGASDEELMRSFRGVIFAGHPGSPGLHPIASPPIVNVRRREPRDIDAIATIELEMERVEASQPFAVGSTALAWADTGKLVFPPEPAPYRLVLSPGDTLTVEQPLTIYK